MRAIGPVAAGRRPARATTADPAPDVLDAAIDGEVRPGSGARGGLGHERVTDRRDLVGTQPLEHAPESVGSSADCRVRAPRTSRTSGRPPRASRRCDRAGRVRPESGCLLRELHACAIVIPLSTSFEASSRALPGTTLQVPTSSAASRRARSAQ